jgi:hypothetical protein
MLKSLFGGPSFKVVSKRFFAVCLPLFTLFSFFFLPVDQKFLCIPISLGYAVFYFWVYYFPDLLSLGGLFVGSIFYDVHMLQPPGSFFLSLMVFWWGVSIFKNFFSPQSFWSAWAAFAIYMVLLAFFHALFLTLNRASVLYWAYVRFVVDAALFYPFVVSTLYPACFSLKSIER